ncbi:SMP-30/gluconolactonase/LRE family protein [Hymenobacter algoricola]|uniref:SMP-30/gluconolactonase/LRE family protein n=1 Tax=Hymenobacter algoricola TaxID=486267 RepID=A0ABP7MQH3_9BACT
MAALPGPLPLPPVEHLLPAQAELGEGAIWNPDDERLYWVDIEGMVLHIFDPATNYDRQLPTGSRVGTVVPAGPGYVVLALQSGIHRLNTRTGELTLLGRPLTDPAIRFNDGKCDPAGRLWVGTMALDTQAGAATLYRFGADHQLRPVLRHVTISNGLVWTADQRIMYYVDTPTQTVQAFDYDHASGHLRNGRPALRIPAADGAPDGMTIDAAGHLWIALWGGGQVVCYDPATAERLHTIPVPAPNTASCAFGGPGLLTLYITTARHGLTPEQLRQYPRSGDLFAVRPGVAGVPANGFRG